MEGLFSAQEVQRQGVEVPIARCPADTGGRTNVSDYDRVGASYHQNQASPTWAGQTLVGDGWWGISAHQVHDPSRAVTVSEAGAYNEGWELRPVFVYPGYIWWDELKWNMVHLDGHVSYNEVLLEHEGASVGWQFFINK